jgi:hypothetical protein
METKTRKLRIDFQKLINDEYSISNTDKLLVYQWIINLGRNCDKQYGWSRYGLHQSFHGYSYNNQPSQVFPLSANWKDVINKGFVNILCKTNNPSIVKDFLIENRIQLGKVRILNITENINSEQYYFSEITNHSYYDIEYLLSHITEAYKGLELKKEDFHSDYENRLHPRILDNVQFGTNGKKWFAWFTLSFECFNYEPGWDYTIGQEEFEFLPDFFDRVIKTIDNLLVPSDNCNNCPLWIEHRNRGTYLRHGYQGRCKSFLTCKKPGVEKYDWGHRDENGFYDNAIHHSIVFPYYTRI